MSQHDVIEENETAPLIDPLVIQILEANATALAHTTNALIDGLQAQLDDERATVAAIRDQISMLLDGPWMPTPSAILRALWPSEKTLNRYRNERRTS
jgi:hypothetical protein